MRSSDLGDGRLGKAMIASKNRQHVTMIIYVTGQTGAHMRYCLWAPECDATPLAATHKKKKKNCKSLARDSCTILFIPALLCLWLRIRFL